MYIYIYTYIIYIVSNIWYIIYNILYIYIWGIDMGIILDALCHMGMDQNLKSQRDFMVWKPRCHHTRGGASMVALCWRCRKHCRDFPYLQPPVLSSWHSQQEEVMQRSLLAPQVSRPYQLWWLEGRLEATSEWSQSGIKKVENEAPALWCSYMFSEFFSGYTSYILPPP